MLKKTIMLELSKKSIEETLKKLEKYQKALDRGQKKGVKYATQAMYEKVLTNCYENRLGEYVDAIHWKYDRKTNTGRVWVNNDGKGSSGMIIIINEFGSGIKGTARYYAKKHGYTINESGKGKTGWAFPTKYDGSFKWTHGIPSRMMFYNAYREMKPKFGKYIKMSIQGTIGELYTDEDKE